MLAGRPLNTSLPLRMSRIVTDQMHQPVTVPDVPQRIVSLVPSQTELLHYLGVDERVVGITKFCIHPSHWRTTRQLIGGTKQFNLEQIHRLQPDLIIGNKEENYPEGIAALQERYPVWMSDITTLEDSFTMIQAVGDLTGAVPSAEALVQKIRESFSTVSKFQAESVVYLIWRDPWMAAGVHTFIDELLRFAGLRNAVISSRYPHLSGEQLRELNPQLVFLSSEPYPFKERHLDELKQLLPQARIELVDGEMFSWYGSRLLMVPNYLSELRLRLES